MDAIAVFSLATLAWLGVQALPLLLWPSLVVALLAIDHETPVVPVVPAVLSASDHSDLALYFARSLGLAQLSLGLVVVVLSGILPLGGVAHTLADGTRSAAAVPYASATLLLTTLYHAAAAFYSYGCSFANPGGPATMPAAFVVGCTGSSALAALGVWCLLFGSERPRLSRRTGADKHTSGFPFNSHPAGERKLL